MSARKVAALLKPKTFEVVVSTFQRFARARPPEAQDLSQETESVQLGYS
jgi:hypothetical protein